MTKQRVAGQNRNDTRFSRLSRRSFLAATGSSVLSFQIVPRYVLGGAG